MKEMEEMEVKNSVCRECADRMGYEPKNKIVGAWVGECDFCGKRKSLMSLWHDFKKRERRDENRLEKQR